MKKDNMIKREVPERLKYGLELTLYRNDVSPHFWEREKVDDYILNEFSKLYCSTNLSDEEWKEYLAFAACEVDRLVSSMPDIPVVPEHSQNDDWISDICRRLGTTSCNLKTDEGPDFSIFKKLLEED